ncbi:MAG: hypothetical protein AAFX06_22805 [Planctomycetota bacterium]
MQRRHPTNRSAAASDPTRREAIGWFTAASLGLVAGCSRGENTDESSQSVAPARDVPLRVALVGTEGDAEAIRLAWSMRMEQPLDIQILRSLRDGEGATEKIAAAIAETDVAIFPQYALGDIVRSEATVRFSEPTLANYDEQYGAPPPAVRNGMGSYGGAIYGVPLGATLFAVLCIEAEPSLNSWGDYHRWVEQLDGKVAEPTSEGWAASSFLNRCATTLQRGWLFDRKSMSPELADDRYVQVLDQFSKTASLYVGAPSDPTAIWKALQSGELRGGIGFETSVTGPDPSTEQFEITVVSCPTESETERLYFDIAMPLAAVSQGCRQTDAAKQFIGWFAGDVSATNLRKQIELGSDTRQPSEASVEQPTPYAKWLTQQLETRRTVPPLALPGSERYYRALDRRVRECLGGKSSAADSLWAASDDWEAITREMGRDQQGVSWRKAMGFGA